MINNLKVAIIGCGQISDAHLGEIANIPNAIVVGVCDLQGILAQDTAERFGIENWYTNYKKMFMEVKPDVVHITTPPQTHLEIGTFLLENGCHIYIEKPTCPKKDETVRLIEIAKRNNVLICPGFMQLEDIAAIRFRSFIESDRFGDVIHVESYYGNCLDDDFSRIFLRNIDHWIHKLPGKLFQNIITHTLYHIIPFFPDKIDEVVCFADDRSKTQVFLDELRVMIRAGNVTGYVTFTSAVKPVKQFVRVYGTKAIAELDISNHVFIPYEHSSLPGPIGRVYYAVWPGMISIWQGIVNAKNFMLGKDTFFYGMGHLFRRFYNGIINNDTSPPVPYEQVIQEAYIMDEISQQCIQIEKKLRKVF